MKITISVRAIYSVNLKIFNNQSQIWFGALAQDYMVQGKLDIFVQVDRQGTYQSTASRSIAYGTMVFMRAGIVHSSAVALSYVVTIATRYSAVRRQTEIRPG